MGIGREVAEAYIDVHGDTTNFRKDLGKLDKTLKGFTKNMEESLSKLEKGWGDNDKAAKHHGKTVDNTRSKYSRLGNAVSGIMGSMRKSWLRMDGTVKLVLALIAVGADQMATLGSGLAASLTAMVSSVGMALANIIPLVATIPALGIGIGLLVGAIGAIKKAGGEAAVALQGIGKAWRDTLIPAFTKEVEAALTSFAKNLTSILDDPELGKALGKAFDGIIRGFDDVLTSDAMKGFMDSMKDELPAAVEGLGRGFAKTFEGLISLMDGAAPAAERIGKAFESWGTKFAASMAQMNKDGTLDRVFDTAYTSGAALLNVTGALGKALGSLFMIGAKHGDELFNSLAAVTNQFNDYLHTANGQEEVNQWFANGVRIIKAMEPLLVGAGRGMALLVNEESIRRWEGLNVQLGEFVFYASDVLRSIGNLDILGSLAALLNGVAKAISALAAPMDNLMDATGRLLRFTVDKISESLLVIGQVGANLLAALGPGILGAESILTDLVGLFFDGINHIARILGTLLTPAFTALSKVIQASVPWFEKVGEVLSKAFSSLYGSNVSTLDLFAKALGAIVMAAGEVLGALSPLVEVLVGGLAYAITLAGKALGALGTNAEDLVTGGLGYFAKFIEDIAPLISNLAALIGEGLQLAIGFLVGHFEDMVKVGELLMPFILSLASALGEKLVEAGKLLMPYIGAIVGALYSIGKVIFEDVIPALGPVLYGAIGGLIDAFMGALGPISKFLGAMVEITSTIVQGLLPIIAPLVSAVGGLLIGAFDLLGAAAESLNPLLENINGVLRDGLMQTITDFVNNGLGALTKTITQDIFPAIERFVGYLADLGNMILDELMPALTPLLETLRDNVGPIIEAVGGVLGAIIDIITNVARALLDQLIPALAPVIDRLGMVVSKVVEFVGPAFEYLILLIQMITPFLVNLASTIGSVIAGALDFLVSLFDGVISILTGLFSGDMTKIIEGFKTIINGFFAFFKDMIVSIVGLIAGFFGSPDDAMKVATDLIDGLVNGLRAGVAAVIEGIVTVATAIIDAFKNFFGIHSPSTVFLEMGGFLLQGLIDGIMGLIGGVVGIITDLGAQMLSTFNTALTFITTLFNDIWTGIKNFLAETFVNILAKVIEVSTNISNFIRDTWNNIKSGWENTLNTIKSTVNNAFENVKNFINTHLNAAKNIVNNNLESIKRFFSNAWDSVQNGVSNAFNNIVNGVRNGINNAVNAVRELPGRALGALGNIANTLLSAGGDMIQGFINGIWNKAGSVASAATSVVKGGVDAVLNFLGIRSPSRLMMKYGGYTGEGFALGIGGTMSEVEAAGDKMAEAATSAFGKSKMYLAGKDAALGLADGLSSGKNVISGALGSLGSDISVGGGNSNIGIITPVRPDARRDDQVAAGGGVVMAEGAIQIVTPTENPSLVAHEVIDEFAKFSNL